MSRCLSEVYDSFTIDRKEATMFLTVFNRLLRERGMNPLSLAKQIGVPKSIVYEWRSGEREPSMENLIRLADFFGVSLEYLTGRTDEDTEATEKELLLLLRAAKTISAEDHEALVKSFKANLDSYLKLNEKNDDAK